MHIIMSGKNVDITDTMRARIEKKLGKLDRFLTESEEVQVRLSQERGNRNTVEITIGFDGAILRAEETSADMITSIDRSIDIIVRQIRRHRTKLEKRLGAGAYEGEEAYEVPDDAILVRTKRFMMKPISVEDAITQMDMLGHSFFLFLNEETGGTCVVYKRQDGNYGLLEPDNA